MMESPEALQHRGASATATLFLGRSPALIQPYSGHASRKSLEVYSRLAIGEAQEEYNNVIGRSPI